LIDWNSNKKTDYKVIQPEPINGGALPENYIALELNKNKAAVGETIKATVRVNNIKNLAGYQVNIVYDPNVLQPIDPVTKLSANAQNQNIPLEKAEEAVNRVIEMIFKEEIFFSQWLWRL